MSVRIFASILGCLLIGMQSIVIGQALVAVSESPSDAQLFEQARLQMLQFRLRSAEGTLHALLERSAYRMFGSILKHYHLLLGEGIIWQKFITNEHWFMV